MKQELKCQNTFENEDSGNGKKFIELSPKLLRKEPIYLVCLNS